MSDLLTLVPERWHVTYTEPHADHGTWTAPARCKATRADAETTRDAVNSFAGPDARRRRTWTITPCDCTTSSL